VQQIEIVRVAIFKLQEAAGRMLTLAQSAESAALRKRLERLSQRLAAEAQRLQTLAVTGDAPPAKLRRKVSASRRAA